MDQPEFAPRLCPAPTAAVVVPIREFVTPAGMHVACYEIPIDRVPVDFFADPDGAWTYEALAEAAGFSPDEGVGVGALREPFNDHPEGAAVVTLNRQARPYIAVVECPIAFMPVEEADQGASAA